MITCIVHQNIVLRLNINKKHTQSYQMLLMHLIMYVFSTTHFIVIFIAMCNIINVNCFIELIY